MTAPGNGDNLKNNAGDQSAKASEREFVKPLHDLIPVWLMVGVFAVVMAITVFALGDNWYTAMTRFRSIKAQQNHEWQTAINQLEKMVEAGAKNNDELISKSPTLLSELGYSYFGLKDYEKALTYYQEAQQYRANFPLDDQGNPRAPADFHNMIGLTYYRMGKLDEAEAALQKALTFNKLDASANFTLGEIAMQRGNYVQAADYFKVVAANPAYESQVKKYYAQIEEKLFAGIG